MATDTSPWVPVIGTLGGVFLGFITTIFREAWHAHEQNKKDLTYLAILVTAHLDRFANHCVALAFDDGTEEGRPAGDDGETYQVTVSPPKFEPLTLDVEWKILPAGLMYKILNLPHQTDELERHISGIGDNSFPWDAGEYFWERQYRYASLGLQVSKFASELRVEGKLPNLPTPPNEQNRDLILADRMQHIQQLKEAYAEKLRSHASRHTSI